MTSPDTKARDDSEGEAAPGFDASLGRLEEIVAELERGGIGLEDSLERYKEGVGLLKGCRERLASFRAQVEELTADGVVPHAGDPDARSAGPAGSGPIGSGPTGGDA